MRLNFKRTQIILISPAKNVNSLSSAASKSYRARTFLPSELLEAPSAELTLGYKLVYLLDAGELCEEDA